MVSDLLPPARVLISRPNGDLLEIGRSGDGPEEYRVPLLVKVSERDLVVVDSRRRRILRFDLNDLSYTSGGGYERGYPVDVASSGEVLVESTPLESAAPQGWVVHQRSFFLLSDEPGPVVQYGEAYEVTRFYSRSANGMVVPIDVPFAFDPQGQTAAGVVVVSDPKTGRIQRFDLAGRETGVLSLPRASDAASDDAWETWIRTDVGLYPSDYQGFRRRQLSEIPRDRPNAPFGRVVLGTDHRLWIESQPSSAGSDSVRWEIVSDRGEPVGTLSVSGRFHLRQVVGSCIVGVRLGELDQEVVEIWRLPDALVGAAAPSCG